MQRLLNGVANLLRIIQVNFGVGEVCFQRIPRYGKDFVGDKLAVFPRLVDSLADNLRDIDRSKRGHNRQHHGSDGKNQLRLQAQCGHKKAASTQQSALSPSTDWVSG